MHHFTRAAVALLSLLCACAGNVDVGSAADDGRPTSAAISSGQVVAGDNPYYWAQQTIDEFTTAAKAHAELFEDPSQRLAPDDALTQRLQYWATELERVMRTVTHNSSVPSPVVNPIVSGSTFNAWANRTHALLGVPVGDPTSPCPPDQSYSFDGDGNNRISLVSVDRGTSSHPASWDRPELLVSAWNDALLGTGSCRLALAQGRIVGTGDCVTPKAGSLDAFLEAESPVVTVATGLVATLSDERSMVFVLAHELGHMFRAHQSPLSAHRYDFWYEAGPNADTRPVPATDSEQLRQEYLAVRGSSSSLDAIPDAVLPAPLRMVVLASAAYTALFHYSPFLKPVESFGMMACPGFSDWLAHSIFAQQNAYRRLVETLQSQNDPAAQAAYSSLEPIFLGCDGLHFFDLPGNPTEAKGIDLRWLDAILSSNGAAFTWPGKPTHAETASAYLARATPLATDLARVLPAFRTKMNTNRIGLYTIEQEADEVAAELMLRLGFRKEDVLAAWIGFSLAFERTNGSAGTDEADTGNASIGTCSQWLQDGFVTHNADGSTTPIVMTLGNLSDVHHGDCYRLYNLWREMNSHHYAIDKPPLAPRPDWSVLVAHAAALSIPAPTSP